ncbi:MAG: phospholipase A [Burkholderiaceae bacterium]
MSGWSLLTWGLLTGAAVAAIGVPPTTARADDETDACLLKALREAPDTRPVGMLRQACQPASAPAGPTNAPAESIGQPAPDGPAEPGTAQIGPALLPDLGDDPDLQSAVGIEAFGFLPHRPNYLLPVAYGRGFTLPASSSKSTEIAFQVSLKLPFSLPELRGRPDAPVVYFAYTGSAWWQAYETRRSSPFREYNHAPELYLQVPVRQDIAGWRVEHAQFGFEHHSNGRTSLESRSWNRLFAQVDVTRDSRYWARLRTWWRLPDRPRRRPTNRQATTTLTSPTTTAEASCALVIAREG